MGVQVVQRYQVIWETHVDAESPEEAAEIAREMQQGPGLLTAIFDVWDKQGKGVCVDLSEKPDNRCCPIVSRGQPSH